MYYPDWWKYLKKKLDPKYYFQVEDGRERGATHGSAMIGSQIMG